METDVLVVGGGLAGLRLACLLHAAGRDVHLIEARDRFGGRVLEHRRGDAVFDLGPAWFWPGQPRIAALVQQFGLSVFEQYAEGAFRFEDARGAVQQGHGMGSMAGSLRLAEGLTALINGLQRDLPPSRLHLNRRMTQASRDDAGIVVTCAQGEVLRAQNVVLALPPRLAAEVHFSPALPDSALRAMRDTPTWMAGQAKILALYDSPFWRAEGLSGDAMSQLGPMVEIHDATPETGAPGALFGFVGVPPAQRRDQNALKAAARDQLTRLFGSRAAAPQALVLQDWASEQATATDADHAPLTAHPRYGMPPALQSLWEGRLRFAGSEVASGFGGYLEGALEAAESAFDALR